MNNDKNLFRQALQRQNERAAGMKMPEDMEQRVMKSIKPKSAIHHWRYPAIVAIAASIVVAFILWPDNPKVEVPVVAEVAELPDAEPSEASEASDYSESSVPAEPVKPKGTNKPRKVSKPAEEPLLAKAEPVAEPTDRDSRDHYEEKLSNLSNPYQLAVAQLQDLRSRGERLDREVAMLMQH